LDDLTSLTLSHPLGGPEELFMARAISNITGEPFPYEDELKGLEKFGPGFIQQSRELKKKLDPWQGSMWTTVPRFE